MKSPALALSLCLAAALSACKRPPPEAHTENDVARRAPPEATPTPATTPPVAPANAPPAPDTTPLPTPTAPGTSPWAPPPVATLQRMSVRQRAEAAIVPFDDSTLLHVRTLFRAGAAAGQQADVFAKLGDSITESGSFLMDIGHGWHELGPWTRLDAVVRYFSRHHISPTGEGNSFTRQSRAAEAGWTTATLLHEGDNSRLEQELAQTRPAFAILMIGTNDSERSNVETYTRQLNDILRRVLARNVVLILSTIPDHLGTPEAGALGRQLNEVVRRVAFEQHLPLVDYWASMQGLPHQGINEDNVHPSIYMGAAGNNPSGGVFTDRALMFGYNMRNLTTLLMFEKLMQVLELHP
jgi:hypothetical protein